MTVCIEDGLPEDVPECSRIACDSEIGKRYGFSMEGLAHKLGERLRQGALLLVAREGIERGKDAENKGILQDEQDRRGLQHSREPQRRILGFAWAEPSGAFGVAPY
ncbi:MAG: hypothetical protein QHH01_07255, partial [Spirochaetales bacterium]|nr:hypothetical protein [Spirochaetales bacterium]